MEAEGRFFLQHGPVRMTIDAWRDGLPDPAAAQEIARAVEAQFGLVAAHMERLRAHRAFPAPDPSLPPVLNKMIAGVEASGCPSLNTLGAVAGAFAEYAAERGAALGCTRVIANNGGDIAIHNREPRPVTVGISLAGGERAVVTLPPGSPIRGVCTSGFGGRSFTKGIADSVTVFAEGAPAADACATVVANAVNVEHPAILRRPAEEIDSGTDIPGQLVTLGVGPLPREARIRAILKGGEAAQRLLDRGVIAGAVLCLGDIVLRVPDDLPIEWAAQEKTAL